MADWGSDFPQLADVADDDIVLIQDVSDTTESPAGTTKGITAGALSGSALLTARINDVESVVDGIETDVFNLQTSVSGLGTLSAQDDIAVPADITATGTADSTTFLRGDGSWAVPPGGGGAVDSVNGATGVVALDASDISIVDTGGLFTATNVEAALAEVKNIADTAAGGGITLEQVQDDLGNTSLVAGTGITKTYNDGANTITLGVTANTYQPLDSDLTTIAAANNGSTLAATTAAFTTAKDSKLTGIETGATADQTNAEIETAYNAQVAIVSQAVAEAGTSTTAVRWTPQRVAQAIAALSPSGGTGTVVEVVTSTAGSWPARPTADLVFWMAGTDTAATTPGAAVGDDVVVLAQDADLTAIAALSTTAYGRGFLTLANIAALQAILGPTGTPSASTYLRGDGSWATPAGGGGGVTAPNAQVGTTYQFVSGDADCITTLSNGSAIDVTVPDNATVAFPVGTELDFAQIGVGQVEVVPGPGVTVSTPQTFTLRSRYSRASLIQTAANSWLLDGDLTAGAGSSVTGEIVGGPTLVGFAHTASVGNNTVQRVTLPAGSAEGDFAIGSMTAYTIGNTVTGAGWTSLAVATGSTIGEIRVLTKTLTSTDISNGYVDLAPGSWNYDSCVPTVAVFDGAVTVDVSATAGGADVDVNTLTTCTAPSVTTTTANTFVLNYLHIPATASWTGTIPGAWGTTHLTYNGNAANALSVGSFEQASAGATATAARTIATDYLRWAAVTVAVKV